MFRFPTYAVVLSVNDKHQIRALDLTQPGLPRNHDARLEARWDYAPVCRAAISHFIKEHDEPRRHFVGKADPDHIIAAVRRGHQTLKSFY
jgi:hypothetical protein